MKKNNRSIGQAAEEAVCAWLKENNFYVKERNFHAGRTGEIDIVAREGKYLCFVEVKYRTTGASGTGAEAVNYHKQKTICKCALFYLTRYGYPSDTPVRFDVAEVTGVDFFNIRYIRDAFEYV